MHAAATTYAEPPILRIEAWVRGRTTGRRVGEYGGLNEALPCPRLRSATVVVVDLATIGSGDYETIDRILASAFRGNLQLHVPSHSGEPCDHRALVRRMLSTATEDVETPTVDRAQRVTSLTPRQYEIAGLVACGMTNPQIAAEIGVAVTTVKGTVANVMFQLGVANRTALAVMMRDAGELKPQPEGSTTEQL